MANEVRTNVVIEGKAKGLDRLASVAKTMDGAVRGFLSLRKGATDSEMSVKKFQKVMESFDTKLKEVARDQLKLIESMRGMDKASQGYVDATKKLKGLEDEQRKVEKQARLTTQAYKEQAKATDDAMKRRGSFTQGVLQGAIPAAAYLQRGPGMFRQAAGAAVGSAGRQMGGGLLSSPFTGAQGLATAAAAIPGGELIAGQIQSALGMAGGALSSMQMRTELSPFLGAAGREVSGAGARAARGVARPELLSKEEIDRQVAAAGAEAVRGIGVNTSAIEERAGEYREAAISNRARMILDEKLGGRDQPDFVHRMARDMATREKAPFEERYRQVAFQDLYGERTREARTTAETARRTELEAPEREFEKKRAEARAQAENAARRRFNAPLNMGVRFGMDRNEMMQMGAQIGQVAGGRTLNERAGREMLPVAAAAQRAFGVDATTAGAFTLGQRRGGIVGAGGAGAEGFTKAIGDAVTLGLSGSELTEYMQQMAEGILSWKTTGISIDPQSIGEMGTVVAKTGIGGVQGARIAQGLAGAGRQISEGGPQTAEQLAIFQDLYGFKGGGLKEYKDALMRAQEGTMEAGGFERLQQRAMRAAGGDEAGGTLVMKDMLQKAGISMSIRDLDMMMKRSRIQSGSQEQLSEEEAARVAQVDEEMRLAAGARPRSQADIMAQAAEMTPGALQQQAAMTNKQLDVGTKMIPTMQNLEKQAASMANAFATGLGPEVATLTKKIADVSKGFENFANTMRKHGFLEAAASAMNIGTAP